MSAEDEHLGAAKLALESTGRPKFRIDVTLLAGGVSFVFALVVACSIVMQKEPPGFSYIALLVFALIPILLLLKSELSRMSLWTPKGAFRLDWSSQQNIAKIELQNKIADAPPHQTGTSEVLTQKTHSRRTESNSIALGIVVAIVDIAPSDGHHVMREKLVGMLGVAKSVLSPSVDPLAPDNYAGFIAIELPGQPPFNFFFYSVKLRIVST